MVRFVGVLLAGACWPGGWASAADFDLSVAGSPNPVTVNTPLTFTIDVTNRSAFAVTNVVVTNTFPAGALFLSASNAFGTTFTNAGLVLFQIDVLSNAGPARVAFSVRPTVVGTFVNAISVGALGFATTSTNVTTQVVAAMADLAAGLAGPPSTGVLVNDLTSYTVSVTNLGPDAAPNIVLTNSLPPAFKLISVTPTNSTISFMNGGSRFHVGQLASNAFASFRVAVQPTNADTFALFAQVSATNVLDTNAANDVVTNTFTVGPFLSGQLIASNSSPQSYNPQTGLMEQTVTLSNVGTNPAQSARVIVQGLTNRLFNAVGTNDGNPFVLYASSLAAGASVDLVMEYFVPTRVPFPDPALLAVEVPAVNLTTSNTNAPNITKVLLLSPGKVLIELASDTESVV